MNYGFIASYQFLELMEQMAIINTKKNEMFIPRK